MKRRPGGSLVAFLGPSLPAAEARRIAPGATVLPPAARGDVWRALALRPRAIALVDGVFESRPSVWHHELLDALDAGVAVFGGGSMGALRAAELQEYGAVGVGEIFRAYRDGKLVGDDEVALLHADAEHGWRGLTVPLVAVRAAARALGGRDGRRLVRAAEGIFYQERSWRAVLAAARLAPAARARFDALAARGLPDPKADDARACLEAAATFVTAGAPEPGAPWPPRPRPSHVRRRRLEASPVLAAVTAVPGAGDRADAGLRTLALAALGRSLGIQVTASEADAAGAAWFERLGVRPRARAAFLAASGLDRAEAARFFEVLALERRVLARAAHLLPDGPSPLEGLALAARLDGTWARLSAPTPVARLFGDEAADQLEPKLKRD
ncbi:MAG TPA: TfuA-like protein [Anaeromyxobacteraceae bacterium]|nr:TfuA-like protein [Anaeromyxobacteraceae bacterium]